MAKISTYFLKPNYIIIKKFYPKILSKNFIKFFFWNKYKILKIILL